MSTLEVVHQETEYLNILSRLNQGLNILEKLYITILGITIIFPEAAVVTAELLEYIRKACNLVAKFQDCIIKAFKGWVYIVGGGLGIKSAIAWKVFPYPTKLPSLKVEKRGSLLPIVLPNFVRFKEGYEEDLFFEANYIKAKRLFNGRYYYSNRKKSGRSVGEDLMHATWQSNLEIEVAG